MQMQNTSIVKFSPIATLVEDYTESIHKILNAYRLLDDAHNTLRFIDPYVKVLPNRAYYGDQVKKQSGEICDSIKARVWAEILKRTQANEVMSSRMKEEFEKQLNEPSKLPEISIDNVVGFVKRLIESAPDMIQEFIKETFDWLKPNTYLRDTHKTNHDSKYELAEKIIVSCVVSKKTIGNGVEFYDRHSEQRIHVMDNAFRLLDGKGIARFPGNSVTIIKDAFRDGKMEGDTEYFKMKFFLNGNMHIEFKRMDLVQKINQIAGKNSIKDEPTATTAVEGERNAG